MVSSVARLLSFFVAALLGGAVVWWMGGKSHAPSTPAPVPAAGLSFASQALVADVSQMPAAARIKLGGYVEPRNVVRLSAQGPGRVTFVAGQEGERVNPGQVVVGLDEDALRPEYRAAWAGLASEMAAKENAQTQLYHKLYGQQTSPMGGPGYEAYERSAVPMFNAAQSFMNSFMPGMTNGPAAPFAGPNGPLMTQAQSQRSWPVLNNARADYERQLAGLAGAQSRIDSLDARLRDRRAVSPRPTVIMKRYVRVGDVVQPGQPLADLADVDQLDVRIEVPTTQIGNLKVGDQVPVTLGTSNVWAPVSQIFPAANDAQRTVTVKLALPAGSAAAPGMYALAWIVQPGGGSPSALAPAIPTSAIAYRGSLPVAFAVNGRGAVEMRVLRLGDVQGDRTAVLSGLMPGEKVVASPSPYMKSGDSLLGQAP